MVEPAGSVLIGYSPNDFLMTSFTIPDVNNSCPLSGSFITDISFNITSKVKSTITGVASMEDGTIYLCDSSGNIYMGDIDGNLGIWLTKKDNFNDTATPAKSYSLPVNFTGIATNGKITVLCSTTPIEPSGKRMEIGGYCYYFTQENKELIKIIGLQPWNAISITSDNYLYAQYDKASAIDTTKLNNIYYSKFMNGSYSSMTQFQFSDISYNSTSIFVDDNDVYFINTQNSTPPSQQDIVTKASDAKIAVKELKDALNSNKLISDATPKTDTNHLSYIVIRKEALLRTAVDALPKNSNMLNKVSVTEYTYTTLYSTVITTNRIEANKSYKLHPNGDTIELYSGIPDFVASSMMFCINLSNVFYLKGGSIYITTGKTTLTGTSLGYVCDQFTVNTINDKQTIVAYKYTPTSGSASASANITLYKQDINYCTKINPKISKNTNLKNELLATTNKSLIANTSYDQAIKMYNLEFANRIHLALGIAITAISIFCLSRNTI